MSLCMSANCIISCCCFVLCALLLTISAYNNDSFPFASQYTWCKLFLPSIMGILDSLHEIFHRRQCCQNLSLWESWEGIVQFSIFLRRFWCVPLEVINRTHFWESLIFLGVINYLLFWELLISEWRQRIYSFSLSQTHSLLEHSIEMLDTPWAFIHSHSIELALWFFFW